MPEKMEFLVSVIGLDARGAQLCPETDGQVHRPLTSYHFLVFL